MEELIVKARKLCGCTQCVEVKRNNAGAATTRHSFQPTSCVAAVVLRDLVTAARRVA